MISHLLYTLENERLQEQIKKFFSPLSLILYLVQIASLHPKRFTALSALVVNKNQLLNFSFLSHAADMIATRGIGGYNWE